MEINLIDYLSRYKNKETIYLYPNAGNAGDALITAATILLFNQLQLTYKLIENKKDFDPLGKIVFYGGGGNLIKYYSYARNFIEPHHKKIKKLIILSHTINSHEDLLAELGDNVDIIAREKYTYDFLNKHATKSHVFLAHDMVFYLNPDHILNYKLPCLISIITKIIYFKMISNKKNLVSFRRLPEIKKIEIKSSIYRLFRKKKILYAFRKDIEKTNIPIPKYNIDLSKIFKLGEEYSPFLFYSSYKILNFINKYDIIHTNRLHVGISSAILGKITYLYPNSYYKNYAVYEHSLKNKYPNVLWMGFVSSSAQTGDGSRSIESTGLYRI
jgi:exopolysaccharide biosynthesis predicted pyruvyltransferase EpsI